MNACMQMWEQMGDVVSDGRIWGNSSIAKLLDDDELGVPKPQKIPSSDRVAPFVLFGDDAFGLKTYLMKLRLTS